LDNSSHSCSSPLIESNPSSSSSSWLSCFTSINSVSNTKLTSIVESERPPVSDGEEVHRPSLVCASCDWLASSVSSAVGGK
jgi:hypothetical protein